MKRNDSCLHLLDERFRIPQYESIRQMQHPKTSPLQLTISTLVSVHLRRLGVKAALDAQAAVAKEARHH